MENNILSKKNERPIGEVLKASIVNMGLAPALNERRIFVAWDEVSGAADWTESKYIRSGVLYCALSSSVVRNRLYPRKDEILERLNDFLLKDELFIVTKSRSNLVKDIVLR